MKFKKKSSPLKLLSQSEPNFAEMILGWSPFKIVSVNAVVYPRWSPLLKIEISSNGQKCSILSQKVPKFELYKHNDELFNSPLFSIFSLVAILVGSRDHRTQFWKGAMQGSFHNSLVAIGPVASEEKIFM
jgi:hypothetical protein